MISTALDGAGVPYMLVGSFASTPHGAPRTTQDIDLVIDPTSASLARFVASLDRSTVYVGPSPQEALIRRDDRQLDDAAAVIAVVGKAMDDDYMDEWAVILGVGSLLERTRRG